MTRPRDFKYTHARLAVGSLFFFHGICFSSWGARIPAIQDKLHLSEPQLGSILFASPLGSIASMPVAAWLVARFGSRAVLTSGIVLFALLLVALGLARSALELAILLAAFGLASNLVNVSLNTQAIEIEAIGKRSIMASLHGLWSVAGFVGAAVGAFMIGADVSPPRHFALAMMIVVIGICFAYRHLLTDIKPTNESIPHAASTRSRRRVPDRALVRLGAIAFCSMICEGAMFDWSGIYFKNVVLAEKAWVSAGYVAFMTTMATTRFFADGFKMRLGLRRVLRISGLVIFLGLGLAATLPTLPIAIIGFLLVGAGVSAVVPLVFSEAGRSQTLSPSAAIAAVSSIGFVGFLVGPPLIGWIAGASSLRASFILIAVMGLMIHFLAMSLPQLADHRKETA